MKDHYCEFGRWTSYKQCCYKYVGKATYYADARYVCATHKASLVLVSDARENQFLYSLVSQESSGFREVWLATPAGNNSFWNWAYKRPKQGGGGCVQMIDGGRWNNVHCSHPLPFVCKKEMDASHLEEGTDVIWQIPVVIVAAMLLFVVCLFVRSLKYDDLSSAVTLNVVTKNDKYTRKDAIIAEQRRHNKKNNGVNLEEIRVRQSQRSVASRLCDFLLKPFRKMKLNDVTNQTRQQASRKASAQDELYPNRIILGLLGAPSRRHNKKIVTWSRTIENPTVSNPLPENGDTGEKKNENIEIIKNENNETTNNNERLTQSSENITHFEKAKPERKLTAYYYKTTLC